VGQSQTAPPTWHGIVIYELTQCFNMMGLRRSRSVSLISSFFSVSSDLVTAFS
jgi:hypothetical protein